MTPQEIDKLMEIQYLKGRLDELYKGYVPHNTSTNNRIVDSRISKYEEKLRSTDEIAFRLYMVEKQNRMYAKSKSKVRIKELLEEILPHITETHLIAKIQKQLDKY